MEPRYYVSIYRDASRGDCTNGGVTSKLVQAILHREIPEVDQSQLYGSNVAHLLLVDKPVMGKPYLKAVPLGETGWVMFGGNFIWSSDSRFRQEVSERPIPVHDRIE